MYTWGSSPQALRLANQIKRRANAKQKNEEAQKREMTKRFEATMMNTSKGTMENKQEATSTNETNLKNVDESNFELHETQSVIFSTAAEHQKSEEKVIKVHIEDVADTEEEEEDVKGEKHNVKSIDEPDFNNVTIEIVEKNADEDVAAVVENITEENKQEKKKSALNTDIDGCDHTTPHLVDTSEVAGEILQISSGLFHFALISSTCTLYTWGKNLEHQLGTEDKERRPVNKPSAVDSIERPMYVECGADYTIVMTTDFVIKAFGGNSNGQCGRDLGASLDTMKPRVVCLPTSKRLMRFESQCIEAPVEINLPRPRIRLDNEPVRYLKSIPKFREHFVQEAAINLEEAQFEHNSYSTTQTPNDKCSSTPPESEPSSDDLPCSSMCNISQNEGSSSFCASYNLSAAVAAAKDDDSSSCGCTHEDQSYARLPMQENNNKHQNNELYSNASQSTLASSSHLSETSTAAAKQYLRNYIHYCLYVFHGLYNAERVRELGKNQLEFCIRTYMLNFKFVEAFQLCLKDCGSGNKTIKVFEYFTKDTGNVPMRRQDLKFIIYYLLQHFLAYNFDLMEVERFFLADLDYYLIELAYVLYFNNNNTMLEQNLNKKFQRLLAQSMGVNVSVGMDITDTAALADHNRNEHKMQDTDVIFDCLSVKFKTIVCQRLLELCSN